MEDSKEALRRAHDIQKCALVAMERARRAKRRAAEAGERAFVAAVLTARLIRRLKERQRGELDG